MKTLSQEYMSAAWGVDIENKLGKKANQVSVNALNENIKALQNQLDSISGGDSDTSLSSLAERLTSTESDLQYLLGTEGTDEEPSTQGKITEIENIITTLDTKVSEQYVSKESITNENNSEDYIFVKKTDYNQDLSNRDKELSEKITTKVVETDSVSTEQIDIAELSLTSDGTDLLLNEKEVALIEDVPKIVYLTQAEYDALVSSGELDSDTYYYTNNEEIYVTKTEFDSKNTQLNNSIKAANTVINDLTSKVTQLESQMLELLETIESLKSRLDILEAPSNEDLG